MLMNKQEKLVAVDVVGDKLEIDVFNNFHNTNSYMTFGCDSSSNTTGFVFSKDQLSKLQAALKKINVNNIGDEVKISFDDDIYSDTITIAIGSYNENIKYLFVEMTNKDENQYTLVEFRDQEIGQIIKQILGY